MTTIPSPSPSRSIRPARWDLQVEFVNVPRGFPIEQLGYTLSRDTILVASPSETIDNIDAITVGPIDFREIDIGTEITLDITLNAGLKNVENVDSVHRHLPVLRAHLPDDGCQQG